MKTCRRAINVQKSIYVNPQKVTGNLAVICV